MSRAPSGSVSGGGSTAQRGDDGNGRRHSAATTDTDLYELGRFMEKANALSQGPKSSFKPLLKPGARSGLERGLLFDADEDERHNNHAHVPQHAGHPREHMEWNETDFGQEDAAALQIGGVTMSLPRGHGTGNATAGGGSSSPAGGDTSTPSASRRSSQSSHVSWASRSSRVSASRRSSSRSRRRSRAAPVGVFWGEKNVQASTQPAEIPASMHHLVLRTLISALRSQVVPDDSIPTVLQPPVGRIDDNFYPDSVKQEHEEYFFKYVGGGGGVHSAVFPVWLAAMTSWACFVLDDSFGAARS